LRCGILHLGAGSLLRRQARNCALREGRRSKFKKIAPVQSGASLGGISDLWTNQRPLQVMQKQCRNQFGLSRHLRTLSKALRRLMRISSACEACLHGLTQKQAKQEPEIAAGVDGSSGAGATYVQARPSNGQTFSGILRSPLRGGPP